MKKYYWRLNSQRKIMTGESCQLWRNVKLDIEEILGINKIPESKKNKSEVEIKIIEAFIVDDINNTLNPKSSRKIENDDEFIEENMNIIIKLLPLVIKNPLHNVPNNKSSKNIEINQNNIRNINSSMPSDGVRSKSTRTNPYYHRRNNTNGIPPPWYVCHTCGEKGHYREECDLNKKFGRNNILKSPSGIPKSRLRLFDSSDEERNVQRYIIDGKVYVEK